MTPGYQMGWGAEIDPARIDALAAGQLDADDIVLIFQDLIEAGLFPAKWREQAQHMVDSGLIHVAGRAVH